MTKTATHGIASIFFRRCVCTCGKTYVRENGLLVHIRNETGMSFTEARADKQTRRAVA